MNENVNQAQPNQRAEIWIRFRRHPIFYVVWILMAFATLATSVTVILIMYQKK